MRLNGTVVTGFVLSSHPTYICISYERVRRKTTQKRQAKGHPVRVCDISRSQQNISIRRPWRIFFRVATTKWMAVLMSAFLRACFDNVLSACLLVFYSWTFLCSARVWEKARTSLCLLCDVVCMHDFASFSKAPWGRDQKAGVADRADNFQSYSPDFFHKADSREITLGEYAYNLTHSIVDWTEGKVAAKIIFHA